MYVHVVRSYQPPAANWQREQGELDMTFPLRWGHFQSRTGLNWYATGWVVGGMTRRMARPMIVASYLLALRHWIAGVLAGDRRRYVRDGRIEYREHANGQIIHKSE